MKQTGKCPKCESKQVMRVERVADAAEWSGYGSGDLSARSGTSPVTRQLLLRRTQRAGLLGTQEEFSLVGDVEAYVCADCGYFEEYLAHPRRIDWSSITHAAPWSPPRGGGGPYR